LAGRLVETGAIERLCYARLGDYARERLGLSPRKLQELARVDRALADLPSLEASLRWNVLPWCKLRLIARITTPETVDDWIERARTLPTRALEDVVRKQARGTALEPELAAEDPERHRWIRLRCSPRVRAKWSLVRELAECAAGQRLGDGEALEWVVAECFSTFAIDPDLVGGDDAPADGRADCRTDSRTDSPAERRAELTPDPDGRQAKSGPSPPREDSDRADGGSSPWIPEWEEVAALLRGLEDADAFELDRRLRRAVHLEQILDATLAPLLRSLRDGEQGGRGSSQPDWRRPPRALSASACEALGMSARKVRALLRLERAGDVCPELRGAYREGRLSWVKAQCLLPLLMLDRADDESPDGASEAEGASPIDGRWKAAWVAWAQRVTVRRLTEDVERALLLRAVQGRVWRQRRDHPEQVQDPIPPGERQLCAPGIDPEATERLAWWVPIEVALLFTGVTETLRRRLEVEAGADGATEARAEGEKQRPVTDGDVFEGLLDEAVRAWTLREPGVRRPNPVIERDGYRCAVPGCSSRRNLQDHHIVFRSVGGSHARWNRVTLCAFHHLRGVHTGRLGVSGQAPERLVFELGLRDRRDLRDGQDGQDGHDGAEEREDPDDPDETRPALVAYRSGDVMMAS